VHKIFGNGCKRERSFTFVEMRIAWQKVSLQPSTRFSKKKETYLPKMRKPITNSCAKKNESASTFIRRPCLNSENVSKLPQLSQYKSIGVPRHIQKRSSHPQRSPSIPLEKHRFPSQMQFFASSQEHDHETSDVSPQS